MADAHIDKSTLAFLADLSHHNDRDWFNAHKERYQAALANMRTVVDALLERLRKHDRISTESGARSLMRIYTDQRFHKDRPPFKPWFAGGIGRVKPALRGGYFYHIAPGSSYLACGFYGPEPSDLKRIRTDILHAHGTWERLLGSKAIRGTFGGLTGAQVRTTPRGFPADHEAIELLRHTQFILRHPLTDADVLSARFVEQADLVYRRVRPFFDHMSEVLTTDANGISLLKG